MQDKTSDDLRACAAALLGAICRAGGAVLWSSGGYYGEEALKAAVTGLEDAATVSVMHDYGRLWMMCALRAISLLLTWLNGLV